MIKKIILLSITFVALFACSLEPEEVTRIVEVTSEVEVAVPFEITVPVEVTFPVEVTRLIEVTRIVEVTSEVEVTREVVVQEIVTATAEPTDEPTPTVVPQTTSSQPTSSVSALLQAMRAVQADLVRYGGFVDAAVRGDAVPCNTTVEAYDRIAGASVFNVANSNQTVQNAYNMYRQAISVFTNNARDMTENCRNFLAGGGDNTLIPFQQWGMARQAVNDAQDILIPAIDSLGG